jgi:hypothetical protein
MKKHGGKKSDGVCVLSCVHSLVPHPLLFSRVFFVSRTSVSSGDTD